MDCYKLMQSWYAKNGVTPGQCATMNAPSGITKHPQMPFFYKHRQSPFAEQSTIANTYTTHASKNVTLNSSHIRRNNVGKRNNSNPNFGMNSGGHSFLMQQSHDYTAAPTNMVQCEGDHIQMSQLTSLSHDSRVNGSHFTHDGIRSQEARSRVFRGSSSDTTGGIPPFNGPINRLPLRRKRKPTIQLLN
jgi:hypothetical protein